MTFILMVFLAAVCLFSPYPSPPWGGPRWLAAALTAACLLVVAGHAAFVAWRVRRRLDRAPAELDAILTQYERGRGWHSTLNLVAYVVSLVVLGWGWFVQGPDPKQTAHGTEVLLLLPFVLGQVLSWVFFYDADRAAHVASHRILDTGPFATALESPQVAVPPFGGRWSFVAFQLRQKLALVFLPVVLLVLKLEAFRLMPRSLAESATGVYGVAALGLLCVLVCLPLVIRAVLGLQPMEAGPLRNRLLATAKRLGFRLNDILVWNTRHAMANAMIVGVVPWVRFVVLTDRMLEEFSDEEIQAVFGHELGHVKHQHMLFYLVFLGLSFIVLTLIADHYLLPLLGQGGAWLAGSYPGVVPTRLGDWLGPNGLLSLFPVLLLLLGYIFLVFGYVSRRCERQADVVGCRAVSCGYPGCTGHDSQTEYSPDGELCPTGIRTFARALDKVASVNGIDRHKPGFFQSWQHSTIARRVAFLLGILVDPRTEPAFQGRLKGVKWGLATGLTAALIAFIVIHGLGVLK